LFLYLARPCSAGVRSERAAASRRRGLPVFAPEPPRALTVRENSFALNPSLFERAEREREKGDFGSDAEPEPFKPDTFGGDAEPEPFKPDTFGRFHF
jgi:hypothetical protein